MPTAARWPDILGNVPEFVFTPRAQHSIMRSRLDNIRNFDKRVLLRLHTFPWQKQIILNRTHVWHLCWCSLPCSSIYGGPTLNFKNTFESPNSNFKKKFEGPTLNSKPWSKVRIWISSTCSKVRLWTPKTLPGPNLNFEKNADVQMWISKHCSKVDF